MKLFKLKSITLSIYFLNISYLSFLFVFLYMIKNVLSKYRPFPYDKGVLGITGDGGIFLLETLGFYLIGVSVLFITLKIFDKNGKN